MGVLEAASFGDFAVAAKGLVFQAGVDFLFDPGGDVDHPVYLPLESREVRPGDLIAAHQDNGEFNENRPARDG